MLRDKNIVIENYIIEDKLFSHPNGCNSLKIQLAFIMPNIKYWKKPLLSTKYPSNQAQEPQTPKDSLPLTLPHFLIK